MSGSLLFTDKGPVQTDLVKSLLFGVAVWDAFGVPVEFTSKEDLRED
jgi:ADP-ribosylglycohydrolase